MATAAMAYGERRFGAAYTVRIFVTLGVLGLVAGLWASQDDLHGSAHLARLWISIGLMALGATLWVAQGKTVLIISDSGVRRESVFGPQEIAWSQITETRYRVVPINVYAHLGLLGAVLAWSSKSGGAQLTLELLGHDRKKLKVTSNFRNADEAIGIILGRIMPPMVQNTKARLQRGETVQFGGLGLSATAINWKGSSVRYRRSLRPNWCAAICRLGGPESGAVRSASDRTRCPMFWCSWRFWNLWHHRSSQRELTRWRVCACKRSHGPGCECNRPDYNKSHQALACGPQSCGHLCDTCTLMLRDHKLVRSRLGAVLSGSRRRTVWRPMSLKNLFVSVAVRHDDES